MAKKTLEKAMTKTEILSALSEGTGLTKKDVASVLDELGNVIQLHVKKRSIGQFTLPGLLKVKSVKKPARKAKKGVPNPFKPGELMDVPAKPATTVVKVLPLKALKEMVL